MQKYNAWRQASLNVDSVEFFKFLQANAMSILQIWLGSLRFKFIIHLVSLPSLCYLHH